ncbi:MAG: amidohydrolase family protein [Eubacteriales bacterium]
MMIDAHAHLWKKQNGIVNGRPVFSLGGGRSDFGGEIRQMTPPYIIDGFNRAEILIANMDYACVNAAVITQEQIDGSQNNYLRSVRSAFPERFKVCSLYEEGKEIETDGFDGIKICAGRLKDSDLTSAVKVFAAASAENKFISIDLSDGDKQTESLDSLALQYPKVHIAIGHFGMAGREGWLSQIKLARRPNVFIESGGITWLFHDEFYPYPSAVEAIKQAAELVGMHKLMWGSDYPRTMTAITYKMSLDFIIKTKQLNDSEKELFLGLNAEKFYGFTHAAEMSPIKNMVE